MLQPSPSLFMRLLARIVVLGLVVFLFATPLIACMTEAAQMSVSEAQCCKAMAGDCPNQAGPASHKCCRTIATVPDSSTPVRAANVAPQMRAVLAPPVVAPSPVAVAATTPTAAPSPPGSPPVCSSILRI